MCNNPLVNGESHFTASFGGSLFTNCTCNFLLFFNMSWAKESADAGIAGLHEWEAVGVCWGLK